MSRAIAVIHHLDLATTIHNALIAERSGFDGICLIHMAGLDNELTEPLHILCNFFKTKADIGYYSNPFVIGANYLTNSTYSSFCRVDELGLDFLWADNPGVSSAGITKVAYDINLGLKATREKRKDPYEKLFHFFGSVAFKTQKEEVDPVVAGVIARSLGWRVVTSGPATGVATELDKVKAMHGAIGPVCIASGATPENIGEMLPYLDTVFVATGISKSFHVFDEDKCKRFIEAMNV